MFVVALGNYNQDYHIKTENLISYPPVE